MHSTVHWQISRPLTPRNRNPSPVGYRTGGAKPELTSPNEISISGMERCSELNEPTQRLQDVTDIGQGHPRNTARNQEEQGPKGQRTKGPDYQESEWRGSRFQGAVCCGGWASSLGLADLGLGKPQKPGTDRQSAMMPP